MNSESETRNCYKPMTKHYTEKEINILREMYDRRCPAKDIAKALGRTIQSVYGATNRYINTANPVFREYTTFDDIDIDMLRAMVERGATTKIIGGYFGITPHQVVYLMRKYGIVRENWPEGQLKKAIQLHEEGYSYGKIAAELCMMTCEVRYAIEKYMSERDNEENAEEDNENDG